MFRTPKLPTVLLRYSEHLACRGDYACPFGSHFQSVSLVNYDRADVRRAPGGAATRPH